MVRAHQLEVGATSQHRAVQAGTACVAAGDRDQAALSGAGLADFDRRGNEDREIGDVFE